MHSLFFIPLITDVFVKGWEQIIFSLINLQNFSYIDSTFLCTPFILAPLPLLPRHSQNLCCPTLTSTGSLQPAFMIIFS